MTLVEEACDREQLLICDPRLGADAPAQVTTCAAFTNSVALAARAARCLGRWGCAARFSGKDVGHLGEPQRCLRLTPAGVVACVARYRLVPPEVPPMKIGRKIGAALYVS